MRTEDIAAIALRHAHQFPADREMIQELLGLATAGADLTSRKEFRGHVTCGAIVLTPGGKLLMIHHRNLDRWLFPGGHLETGDISLRQAALRELTEETRLAAETFTGLGGWLDELPLHIDCHPIPANLGKEEPEHRHWDFRYVFRGTAEVLEVQAEEVINWANVDPDQAPDTVVARLRELKLL